MRLIDSDALDYMICEAQAECKRNGGNFRFGVLSNVRENIKELPAIDAIPLDWLRNMMLEREAEESRAAWVVMREWEKGQEART